MNATNPILPCFCSLALAVPTILPAGAQLIVYEGFGYAAVGDELVGQPDNPGVDDTDAIGLTGTWADAVETSGTGNDMYLKSGSLVFSDLATSGQHIGFLSNQNSDIYNRSLATTGFTQPVIYFSFLFEKLQNNFGAAHEGLALMNGILPSARWDSGNPGEIGRHGFAVAAVSGDNLQAVAYDGTTGTQVVGAESIPITVVNGGSNTSTSNEAVNLIVGEISFNTGTDGADVFKLYAAVDDGSLDESDLTLIDTIEADVDESTLSTLNLTRQVNVNYDEVRIGTSLSAVLGLGAGTPTVLPLTIVENAGTPGNYDFSWDSQEGMLYDLVSATDLTTAPETWNVWEGQADLVADPPTNTLTNIAGGGDARRFFAVVEKEIPPPPPLLEQGFEGGGMPEGWVPLVVSGTGTTWEVGDPTGGFETGPPAAASGSNCAGTNIDAAYTASVNVTLTSPEILIPADSGALLEFQQFIDTDLTADLGSVRILDSGTNALIGTLEITDIEGNGTGADWTTQSLPLPAVDVGGKGIKIEFQFVTDDASEYGGFYIDDVVVTLN